MVISPAFTHSHARTHAHVHHTLSQHIPHHSTRMRSHSHAHARIYARIGSLMGETVATKFKGQLSQLMGTIQVCVGISAHDGVWVRSQCIKPKSIKSHLHHTHTHPPAPYLLQATEVQYVRCIKPNSIKSSCDFNLGMVAEQLRCGVCERMWMRVRTYSNS